MTINLLRVCCFLLGTNFVYKVKTNRFITTEMNWQRRLWFIATKWFCWRYPWYEVLFKSKILSKFLGHHYVIWASVKQRQSAMSLCFCNLDHTFFILDSMLSIIFIINKGRRDCMIVGFTTTYLCLKWGQVKNLCHWPKLHNGGPKILTKFYS
jgi:hypothetical protein